MKRILMMVLRNIIRVPFMWIKLCYMAAHADKYTDEEHNKMCKYIVERANIGGNVVIKTTPGLAQAVAAGIDTLHDADILGCVAGDDCIILVSKTEEASKNITNKLLKIAGK
jgi:arginine repressor